MRQAEPNDAVLFDRKVSLRQVGYRVLQGLKVLHQERGVILIMDQMLHQLRFYFLVHKEKSKQEDKLLRVSDKVVESEQEVSGI